MNFSFDTTAGASQSTSKPRLAGNDIYEVIFDECEIKNIEGKQEHNAGTVYKTLVLKFSNSDGVFEHTVFEPKPEDFKRGENKITNKNGAEEKIPQASNVESMMLLFKHLIDSVNPTIAKQIDAGTKSLSAPDWEGLRQLVAKILNMGKGTEVKIKLLTNKKGEAIFPGFFAGLTKPDSVTGQSKAYIKNNFIGDKVAFTSYEMTRITNAATAKPTPVAKQSANIPTSHDLDINFDL